MGLEITVLSTTASKKEEALKNLGADHFVVSKNKEEMEVSPNPPLSFAGFAHYPAEVWTPNMLVGGRVNSSFLNPPEHHGRADMMHPEPRTRAAD